ncbi:lariat debranching enzyme-like [Macrobrachium nipponense]|uniref:lariat debranching enzyme-like n=1 Tax=Macrobrachium nipponense TaxID=159736 RepID=UPI0030C89AE5
MCLVFYRYQFTPTPEEIESTIAMMESDLKIAESFAPTAKSYSETNGRPKMDYVRMPPPVMNPQTVNICSKLGIDDPVALLLGTKKNSMSSPRVTPPRSGLNSSELNITLESSKLSVTNVDENACSSSGFEAV